MEKIISLNYYRLLHLPQTLLNRNFTARSTDGTSCVAFNPAVKSICILPQNAYMKVHFTENLKCFLR